MRKTSYQRYSPISGEFPDKEQTVAPPGHTPFHSHQPKTSDQRNSPIPDEFQDKEQTVAPPGHTPFHSHRPVFTPIPNNNGRSTLYDSFELGTMTTQLNKAMHSFNYSPTTTSPTMSYLNSPFCRRLLDSIHRENAKAKKKIACSNFSWYRRGCSVARKGSIRGFVCRLWQKVKQGLHKNKERNKR